MVQLKPLDRQVVVIVGASSGIGRAAALHMAAAGADTTPEEFRRVVDALLTPVALRIHDTGEPKAADAPTSLYAPLDSMSTVEGSFGRQALRRSLYTWLATHRAAGRLTAIGAALGALALLSRRR